MLKTKLLTHLFLIYILLISSSIVFLNIVLFSFVNSKESDIFYEQVQSLKFQITNELNQVERSTANLSEQIYRDPNLINNLYMFSTNTYSQYQSYLLDSYLHNADTNIASISTYINSQFLSLPSLSSIYLYSNSLDRMSIYQSHRNDQFHYTSTNIENALNIPDDLGGSTVESLLSSALMAQYDFPFVHRKIVPLNHPSSYKNFGFMVVSHNISALKTIETNFPSPIQLTLSYPNNEIVGEFKSPGSQKNSTISTPIFNDKNTSFSIPWGTTGLRLDVVIPIPSIYEKMYTFYIWSILISIALFFILIFIFRINLKYLDKLFEQILLLIAQSQKGNLSYRIPVVELKNNELTLIASQLNKMNEQLDAHIKSVYIAETRQKEAYIRALQNQVDPHFLYNTLELIRTNALKHGNREIGAQLASLSRLHRNLVKGDSHVTLRKELEFCRSYIEIQSIRYENSFTYEINCDHDTMHYLLPKFILQPIIENYFKYGLIYEKANNILTISSHFEHDLLKIIIYNNGNTFPREILSYIQDSLNLENQNESIGLANIHQRISLEYGSEYGLKVCPSNITGVSFVLEFPKKGLKYDDEDIVR